MKKFMAFMALLLPLFAFEMSADEKEAKPIPLTQGRLTKLDRSIVEIPIEAYYIGMTSSIQTTVSSDLGTVEIIVTNLATGESRSDIFDSGLSPWHELQISSDSGNYEIIYVTESGDLFQGLLTL
ncbi:MAG: DUF3244 domain-containing protein [Bacteroidales bacterium]|nr:DUF3244 domain-containing protein [Bacteroidales bacterium]MBO7323043.1 DUF3244 domain-containing protein [Bacteroidales bacterium]